MIERPPEPVRSDASSQWKRRQRRLLALLAVLMVLEVVLIVRGVMLLPAGHDGPAAASKPTATATLRPSPTATSIPPPPPPSIQAAAAMLVNTSDGNVLFTQNVDAQ